MLSPLVSIIIDHTKSYGSMEKCLESIQSQTYSNVEIFVSTYRSIKSRSLIVRKSRGEFVLILDTDHILEKNTIERAIKEMNSYDMLCLEEHNVKSFVSLDFHPISLWTRRMPMPRFYRKSVLEKAFESIEDISSVHETAIIYWRAYKISQRTGSLSNAIWRIPPHNLLELLRKYFISGRDAKKLDEEYAKLAITDALFGQTLRREDLKIYDIPILLLKTFSYVLGYVEGSL